VLLTAVGTIVCGGAAAAAPAAARAARSQSSAYPLGTCGVTGEYDQAQTVSCASVGPDSTITGVSFASFGTPTGSCATGFTADKQCQKDVASGVLSLCKGKKTCAVTCLGAVWGPQEHPLTPRELTVLSGPIVDTTVCPSAYLKVAT
jgi:hypothetical protein